MAWNELLTPTPVSRCFWLGRPYEEGPVIKMWWDDKAFSTAVKLLIPGHMLIIEIVQRTFCESAEL